jgi:hypothetical protein
MSNEIWRVIPGFSGRYFASDCGRVKSIFGGKETILTSKPVGIYGHAQIGLRSKERRVFRYVHQWVLLAFVGPAPDGTESLHIDGNAKNCHLSNLHYGTRKQNAADRVAHGKSCVGTENGRAKISPVDVRAIRSMWAQGGMRQRDIGSQFGVTQGIVGKIIRHELWRHVP